MLAIFLSVATLAMSAGAQGAVRVFVDGDQVMFDQPPITQGGRVLVPLRGIFEKMGAVVEWNAATRTVRAARGTTLVELQIGSRITRQPATAAAAVRADDQGHHHHGDAGAESQRPAENLC